MTNTQNLSSQITGNDFSSAHRSRMEVNNQYFIDIAKELTKDGYTVYTTKNGLISFILVENENNHIYFGFADVPYRWYLNYDIDYTKGNGSGRTLEERHDYNNPFTSDELIAKLQPKARTIMKPNQYLKLFTI